MIEEFYKKTTELENGFWWDASDCVGLPQGSIKKLIGRDLQWEDDPVELE